MTNAEKDAIAAALNTETGRHSFGIDWSEFSDRVGLMMYNEHGEAKGEIILRNYRQNYPILQRWRELLIQNPPFGIFFDPHEVMERERKRSNQRFIDAMTSAMKAVTGASKDDKENAKMTIQISASDEAIGRLERRLVNVQGGRNTRLLLEIARWIDTSFVGFRDWSGPGMFIDRVRYANTPKELVGLDNIGNPICCDESMTTISKQGFYQCNKCEMVYSFCPKCDEMHSFSPRFNSADQGTTGDFGMACHSCGFLLVFPRPDRTVPKEKKAAKVKQSNPIHLDEDNPATKESAT